MCAVWVLHKGLNALTVSPYDPNMLVFKLLKCLRDSRMSVADERCICPLAAEADRRSVWFLLPSRQRHPAGEFIRGWHHLNQYGVIERKYSARALFLLLVSALSPPWCAAIVAFALHSRRQRTPLCARSAFQSQAFQAHPNTRVFGLWRSATEVKFKSAWNQEVGGSVRDCIGAPAARQAAASAAGWVGVCLVLAVAFNLSEIARRTGVAAVHTVALICFLFFCLWRDWPQFHGWKKQRALLDRSPAPSDAAPSAHQHADHSGFCLRSAKDISNRKTILGGIKGGGGDPNCVLIKKGKVYKGIAPLGSVYRQCAVAEAHCGETHGSLCPKGAVALWAALDSLFLEKLLRSLHGYPRLKRRRPHGPVDYTVWKAECETRPYLTELERNISTYLPRCQPCHIKGMRVRAYHYICF